MRYLAGVPAGVAVGRGVAATDLAAGHAHAQVQPAAANGQAVLAAGDRGWKLGELDLVEMGANGFGHDSGLLGIQKLGTYGATSPMSGSGRCRGIPAGGSRTSPPQAPSQLVLFGPTTVCRSVVTSPLLLNFQTS